VTPIKIEVTAAATPSYERDQDQTYLVDPRTLASGSKISDLKHETFPNGMLKSVNASAEDQTAQVIVNTVTGIAKLAEAAAKIAAQPAMTENNVSQLALIPDQTEKPIQRNICNAKTRLALEGGLDDEGNTLVSYKALKSKLDSASEALDGATKNLKALIDVAPLMGRNVPTTLQSELVSGALQVVQRQNEVAALEGEVKQRAKQLSIVDAFRWPENGQTISATRSFDLTRFRQWFAEEGAEFVAGSLRSDVELKLSASTNALLALTSNDKKSVKPLDDNERNGIRYRVPALGSLQLGVCSAVYEGQPGNGVETACKSSNAKFGWLKLNEGSIPQLGRVFALPYKNEAFQNNMLAANFSEDGNLVTAEYADKASRAAVASEAFAKVAGALNDSVVPVQAAGANAKAAIYKAQTSELQAKAELDKAKAALRPTVIEENATETALVNSETALLNAQRLQIEAQKTLDNARTAAGIAPEGSAD
jgi:hypothetical protein